ncbi:MAG: AI-2E family transporter [Planctomycetota bacterium]
MTDSTTTPTPTPPDGGVPAIIRIAAGLLIAFLIVTALYVMESVFRPFFVALFLAFAFRPLSKKLVMTAGSRILGYVLAGVLVFGFFFVSTQIVAANLQDFQAQRGAYQKRLGSYLDRGKDFVDRASEWMESAGFAEKRPEPEKPDPATIEPETADGTPKRPAPPETDERRTSPFDESPLTLMSMGTKAVLGALGEGIVILVFMLLMMMELDRIHARIDNSFPPARARAIHEGIEEVDRAIQKYIVLKIVVSLLTALLSAGILLLFGVPYILTFALIIFLFNFIPYIGSIIATIAPVAICVLHTDSERPLLTGVFLALSLSAVQQVIGNFVEPKMQGKDLQLSPVVILLALAFWGWIWGITGMILAVPLMSAVRIVLARFESTAEIAKMMADVEIVRRRRAPQEDAAGA